MSDFMKRLFQALGLTLNADEERMLSQLAGRKIRVTERGGLVDENTPVNWITHDGGEIPCEGDELVTVRLLCGQQRTELAKNLKWPDSISYNPRGHDGNIVKWRPAAPNEEEGDYIL